MKATKRLVSVLLVFSMIASMFLSVTAVTETAESSERTGITVEREQSANVFGEAVTHTKGYYVSDKKLQALPYSYEAWVYIPSEVYDTASGVILGTQWDAWDDTWNGADSGDTHFTFGIKPGGHPTLVYGTKGSKQVWEATGKGVIPADKWTHVVMLHDTRAENRFVWCFIDGGGEGGWSTFEKVGKDAGLLELDSTALNNPVYLAGDGFRGNSHALSSGIILGDVAVYSDRRSATEVVADYTNGPDLTDPNLLLYYQISSDNQNKDIKDVTGHGYDMSFYRTFLTEAEMNEIRAKDEYEYTYSIAFLPDLQYMTNRFPNRIGTIFDYIIENKEEKNLQYVVGLGDITDQDKEWEWNVAKAQYDLLDAAGIPYTLIRGNHDIYTTDKVMFDETFGKDSAYYKHVQENGGFYDTNSATNAYVLFEVGNVKYLILCLDWGIKDTAVLDWADGVMEAHSDRNVIVTMHAWMNSDGTRFADGDWALPSTYNSSNINPQQMWNDYFAKHSNIDMVVCGHMHSDNIFAVPVQGTNGNTVYQILIDSQASDLAVGSGGYNGLGLVAYMYFTEDGNHAKIEYYSTTYNRYYYEKNTEISLDFGTPNKFIESDGTPLVPNSTDSAKWTNEDGKLSLNNSTGSLLRYENVLDYNRVEVTMATGTSTYKKSLGGTIREGLIFNVSDDGKSYYWVFVTQYNSVEVVRIPDYLFMSTPKNNCGSTAIVNLDTVTFDIDLNEFTLAAEWDNAGNIKILINDNVVYNLKDPNTPLTGKCFGLRSVKGKATDDTGTYFTSYLAGEKVVPDTPDTPVTPEIPETPVYDNFKDAEGNVLNPYFVNDVIWDNNSGKVFLPEKPAKGFLLFDNELKTNRIEATIVVKDNMGSATGYDGNKRAGLVFALTDHDGDGMFNADGTDVSYYWAFINNWGCLEVIEMGRYGNWQWLSSKAVDINEYGINTDAGVTLAAEWNDQGHIRIFANDQLVQNIIDPTPLTGDLYGIYAVKHSKYASDPSLVNTYYTSFVAGTEIETPVNKVEVAVDPTDAGTVTGAGEYYLGASVTLTATPNEGYYFVGWYDNDKYVCASETYTFRIWGDLNLTAKFTTVAHNVTVTAGANGTVAGSGSYGEGAHVTVVATPDAGYKFVGWYENDVLVSTDADYTFALTGNVELVAKFDNLTYSVAVDGNGNLLNPYFVNGNIWTEADGTIKPAPGPMENFLLFDNPLNANRIEATFRNLPYTGEGNTRHGIVFALTDIQGDHAFDMANEKKDGDVSYYFACISGWGEIQLLKLGGPKSWTVYLTGGGVDLNGDVTLAVEWDAEGNVKVFANGELRIEKNVGEALTGNLYGILMRSYANTKDGGFAHKVLATSFVAGTKQAVVTATPTEGGTVAGAGDYELGATVTLTATANEGYIFKGWYENGKLVSESATITFIAEADRTLTAKFVVDAVYGDANGDGTLDMNDVALIREYIAKLDYDTNTSSVSVEAEADVNGDGQINMKDVILLRQYIANNNG